MRCKPYRFSSPWSISAKVTSICVNYHNPSLFTHYNQVKMFNAICTDRTQNEHTAIIWSIVIKFYAYLLLCTLLCTPSVATHLNMLTMNGVHVTSSCIHLNKNEVCTTRVQWCTIYSTQGWLCNLPTITHQLWVIWTFYTERKRQTATWLLITTVVLSPRSQALQPRGRQTKLGLGTRPQ